ncbi:hypothetical protein NCER_102540 [Vairimorpha ceranae BRL01]|uniref:Uncharacterized protein n=1 Tax=Vairimorpha ceranae (strain BRL01) TaxID=578460 RepID=C4VC64_VAIC1|nr:hypothetical protein NCER_102540 [Vairimorpha ceranae BRL01]
MKQSHNIENVKFTKYITRLIFVVNDRLVIEEDLPILRMLFRIIKYKKNTRKCINTLNEQIKIYENCDSYFCFESHTRPATKRANLIEFRDACNELENFKGQSVLALTKQAICFYIKDDTRISKRI